MKLTQQQEGIITRYLAEAQAQFDTVLPERARQEGLLKLQLRITGALSELGKKELSDDDVRTCLERLGTPAQQAASVRPARRKPAGGFSLHPDDRVWLGVCGGLAAQFGVEPRLIRVLALVSGVLGPLALFGYIGLYAAMYFNTLREDAPGIRTWDLFTSVLPILVIAIGLRMATGYSVDLIEYVHTELLHRPVPALGEWGWLLFQGDNLFFYCISTCFPLSILGGLPLANGWDQSLRRLAQAGLALYAVALAFGIASIIVGVILDYVQDFTA